MLSGNPVPPPPLTTTWPPGWPAPSFYQNGGRGRGGTFGWEIQYIRAFLLWKPCLFQLHLSSFRMRDDTSSQVVIVKERESDFM